MANVAAVSAPALEPRSDRDLLDAHRAGEPRAFGELVARHRDRLWALAMRIVHHPDDAADALQDALVSAYRGCDSYRGEAAVGTWLHRIVVNTCLDRLRRDRAHALTLRGLLPRQEQPDHAEHLVTRLTVQEALALLAVDQRLAVFLVDVKGYPMAEVAAILGVPVGTVKSRCARGRLRLAALLGHLRRDLL